MKKVNLYLRIILYLLLTFLPICFTYVYFTLRHYFNITYNIMYTFMPIISMYMIYLCVGVIFGKVVMHKEQKSNYKKHGMVVSILEVSIPFLLIIAFNSIFTQLIQRAYDPYRILYVSIIIYLCIGVILGSLFMHAEQKKDLEKHGGMMVNIIGAMISLLLSIALNSIFTLFVLKDNFDPYNIWAICLSFLLVTVFTKKKDTIFYLIFSIITILLPLLIYFIRKAIGPEMSESVIFVHIVYFCLGVLFALPYLRKEYLSEGTWKIKSSNIILGVFFLVLAVVFNGDISHDRIFNLDYFLIWTLSSAFLLATSVEKQEEEMIRDESVQELV